MICTVCNGPMKPLIVSWFCPNDCDRKPPSRGIDYSKIRKVQDDAAQPQAWVVPLAYRAAYTPIVVQSNWPHSTIHLYCPYPTNGRPCGGRAKSGTSPTRAGKNGVHEYDCMCDTCSKTWVVTI